VVSLDEEEGTGSGGEREGSRGVFKATLSPVIQKCNHEATLGESCSSPGFPAPKGTWCVESPHRKKGRASVFRLAAAETGGKRVSFGDLAPEVKKKVTRNRKSSSDQPRKGVFGSSHGRKGDSSESCRV